MQIKKLEIAGFKSFGPRRVFEFSDGITAIVGPNGSGKSNVADAIRWVLGDQKNRRLRIAKAEDIIFYGTKTRPRASLAEVSLLLDNSSGNLEIDSSEIELSRRLLRSGESEYRLNGRKTKLSKIEALLAQAGFGAESYTVIGQGMIDQLLTATGVERKTLFDEASGIRQYDIQRSSARRDLQAASDNLERVSGVLQELRPTISILEKQSASLQKAENLKRELKLARENYLNGIWGDIQKELADNQNLKENHSQELKIILDKINKLHNLVNTNNDQAIVDTHKELLTKLESERDLLTQKLLASKAELSQLKNRLVDIESSKTTYSELSRQHNNLQRQLAKLEDNHTKYSVKIDKLQSKIDIINTELGQLTTNLNDVQNKLQKSQKKEFVNHALGLVQLMRVQLRQGGLRREIDITMHKLAHMLELALEDNAAVMASELIRMQNSISKLMAAREDISELQTEKTIILRSLELDITKLQIEINNNNNNLADADKKTKLNENISKDISEHQSYIDTLETTLSKITIEITKLRDELYDTAESASSSKIEELEKLASKKTRLEMDIENISQNIAHLQQKQTTTKSLAQQWFGRAYSFMTYQAGNKYPSLNDIEMMQAELTGIEEIDPQLIVEARESSARIDFLQTQQKDLEKAIADTNSLITSLERDMKKKFQASFKKLNIVFGEYFKKLFKGGSAALELRAEDSELGIEIIVQPPGKRGKNISALSGGEKAMAAIALLAAIIITNPSPFIVLDEVDAALDDENSNRFTTVLKELSKHSQMLVITHNHETMQAAHNLFGITTTPKGDSEVLQLTLQHAQEYATS